MVSNYEENNVNGYVKIHRSILKKAWYKKSDFVHLWAHLIMSAKFTGNETWWNGSTKKLKPGQFVTGRKKLSLETGINESKVERILNCFESEQQIEQQKTPTSRLITILNWKKFQTTEQPFEQRPNNDRTTGEQRVNTIIRKNKNYKKDNSEGKRPPIEINGNWVTKPSTAEATIIELTKDEIDATIQFMYGMGKGMLRPNTITNKWIAFKVLWFNNSKEYPKRADCIQHFRNWLKDQKPDVELPNQGSGLPSRLKSIS